MPRVLRSGREIGVAAVIALGAILCTPVTAPAVIPAKAGTQSFVSPATDWIPAFTGTTDGMRTDTLPSAAENLRSDTIGYRIPPSPAIPLAMEADLLARASLHALSAPLRWSGREWATAAASVGAVALFSTADEAGRDLMERVRSDRNTRVELLVEPFGAERSLQLMGGMLVTGLVIDDEKLRSTAVEGLSAGLVAAGIVTPALQKVIGRAKPRARLPAHSYDPFGGDRSLPSGHTTQAFAVASVLATEYAHPAVQVAAYGMAAAVGVSRMYRRSHFLSDVLGAAIIGTATGRSVARYGIRRREARAVPRERGNQEAGESISVMPMVGPDGLGLMFDVRF